MWSKAKQRQRIESLPLLAVGKAGFLMIKYIVTAKLSILG
jgi:hypothetical protein